MKTMEQPPKPLDIPVITYIWSFVIAVWGGLVRYLLSRQDQQWKGFRWVDLLVQVITSGFAGILALLLIKWAGINETIGAVVIAIAGHAGGETIRYIRSLVERWYGNN